MSQSPDEIRAEIERTRQALGSDVDEMADRVNPSNIAHRQTEKVKHGFSNVKETVMGKAENVKESVLGKAEDVKDSARDHTGQARNAMSGGAGTSRSTTASAKEKAAGNPLAAGLIAFGAGLLVASLIPASQKEQEVASQLKEQAAPLKEKVTDAAKQIGEEVREPAQKAAQSVKESATDSAQTVKEEGQQAAGDVKGSAQDAQSRVQQQK